MGITLKRLSGFVLLWVLVGCGSQSDAPLRIGSNNWPGYQSLYLAYDINAYSRTQVSMVQLGSATQVLGALRNGNLDGAALTLDETLLALADGVELQVVAVLDYSNGADVVLVKPEIKTLLDLKGRKVVVEHSAVGAIMLDSMLHEVGFSASDIEVVARPFDLHESTFQQEDIAAVVTFEPIRSRLLAAGAHEIFSSASIPGRIIDVLVVRTEIIDSKKTLVQQLVNGHFMALDFMKTKHDKSYEKIATRMNLSKVETQKSFEGLELPTLAENKALLVNCERNLQKTADYLTQIMLERKLLAKPVNTKDLCRSEWVQEIAP